MLIKKKRRYSRRDFLKLGATVVGGTVVACARGEDIVQLTATLVPEATPPPAPALLPGEAADSILLNGNLYTMDAALPTARALAVKDGNILQVGSDESIRSLAGENTTIIDASGKTVTPGMVDAHNHLQVYGSLHERFVPLLPPDVHTLDAVIAGIKQAVDQVNPGVWVQAVFWDTEPLPTKRHLDPVSPDNPVWLIQQGGHYGIANSMALDIAGITPETQNPVGGIIERDASGELTGMFYNHKAMDLLRMHAPIPTEGEIISYIKYAGDLFAAAGVTSFQDVNVRFNALEPYIKAASQGLLLPRAQIFYTLEWPSDLERALNEMPTANNDFMKFSGFKFLIDGQFPTWYTHEPHPGISWDMPTWDIDLFKDAVKQLHDTGLQIAIHCGGDAAVDLTLEAFEEAMDANPRPDPRHRIEHAVLTKPHATQKMVDLGVSVSCQPQFLRFTAYIGENLGEERGARLKVTREWLDAGVNVALGSDAGSTPWYTPNVTLLGAVTRLGADDKPFHPEQSMTIQEALYAHTMGSAYAGHEENIKGSLTPGKMADLVVWSDDFYTVDPMDIVRVKADMTMINGQVVHGG